MKAFTKNASRSSAQKLLSSLAIAILLIGQAHGGTLLPEDLAAARKEFRSSFNIDTQKYALNSELTGCALRTCENMAPRHAVFERVLSVDNARVLRVERYPCEAAHRSSLTWKCREPYIVGKIVARGKGWFSLSDSASLSSSEYVDDDTIVDIAEYASGGCVREQLPETFADSRHWRVSAILSIDGNYVLSFFDDIFEVKHLYLRPLEGALHACHFQIVRTGGSLF